MKPQIEEFKFTIRSKVFLDDEEFYHFCQENRNLRFERNKKGQIFIMPNTGGKTGRANLKIATRLGIWNEKTQIGEAFDSSTAFRLPNSAVRSPDAAWIAAARWAKLSEEQQSKFPPLCPDFVIELKSESDTVAELQEKMEEWRENGCQLGWLIDLKAQKAWIYRAADPQPTEVGFDQPFSGENILPGFILNPKDLQ